MTFFQWRRFNFFDISKNVDDGHLETALQNSKLTAYTSGRGRLIYGDDEGCLHFGNRQFGIQTIPVFQLGPVYLLHQMKQSGLLMVLGQDDEHHVLLKVFNIDKPDKNGNPSLERSSRVFASGSNTIPTSIAVHENLNFMAIGFESGEVILYQGDVTKERGLKEKKIHQGHNPISGLSLRSEKSLVYLYVATTEDVSCYTLGLKNVDNHSFLDNLGCPPGLAICGSNLHDVHFITGRKDAVYCYTNEGRGQCYAFEGEKVVLHWFRNYLVIVHSEPNSGSKQIISVFDLQNKFIAYTAPVKSVKALLSEWGYLFILTDDNRLLQLEEKDIQSKLDILFKKNFYDIAVKIAKHQQYDEDGLVDIFRQYGDHLYTKGDYTGAIENYVKTIGHLEPSYIIRKFLDAHKIHFLTQYLQALHSMGLANEDHTTLLLNCYTKLKDKNMLDEFILKDRDNVDFDVDIAIKVCRQSGYTEHALNLAEKHQKHEWYLKMQIEDVKGYREALNYIQCLEFEAAEYNMKKYGSALMHELPSETTELLKKLCTFFSNPATPTELISDQVLDDELGPSADPEQFLHLFVKNSDMMVNFLEYMIGVKPRTSGSVYTTLLEHYLHQYSATPDQAFRKGQEEKVMLILKNETGNYDEDHILILCQRHAFKRGALFIFEKKGLFNQILRYHAESGDFGGVLQTCRKFGSQEPNLWVLALQLISAEGDAQSAHVAEILDKVEQHRLLSPLLVISMLSNSPTTTLKLVRPFLLRLIEAEDRQMGEDKQVIQKYLKDTKEVREKMDQTKNSAVAFQVSKCCVCDHPLDLPSIHFLCQHSYHKHCFQSYSDSENECPACLPENSKILEIIESQKKASENHDDFQHNLEVADNSFAVVAEYFGHGMFRNEYQMAELAQQVKEMQPKLTVDVSFSDRLEVGPGAEARIRLGEKTKGTTIQPSEGRIRAGETSETVKSTPSEGRLRTSTRTQHSPILAQKNPVNPFEEAEEDKNPFSEREDKKPENPFGDPDDDYEESLNPFGET